MTFWDSWWMWMVAAFIFSVLTVVCQMRNIEAIHKSLFPEDGNKDLQWRVLHQKKAFSRWEQTFFMVVIPSVICLLMFAITGIGKIVQVIVQSNVVK